MVDIFISYSSKDRGRVRQIRDAFAARGFTVFWDQDVAAGSNWNASLRDNLLKARCVVVVWSKNSAASVNVLHEAEIAKEFDKLVPMLLEPLKASQLPMGHYSLTSVDLSDWNGDVAAPNWKALLQGIEVRVGGARPVPTPVRGAVDDNRRRLEIKLINGNLVNVQSPAYVLGVFDRVNPTGAAREVDALLGGTMSSLVHARMFGSRLGEVSLLPTPRRRALTDMVAFVGLGPISDFNSRLLELVGENLTRVFVSAGVNSFTTVPLGANAGGSVSAFAKHFLEGVCRGLEQSDPEHNFRSVGICEFNPSRFEELNAQVTKLAVDGVFKIDWDTDIAIRASTVDANSPATASAPGQAVSFDPLYLQVNGRQEASGDIRFDYTLLTAGKGAVIQTEQQLVPREAKATIDRALSRMKEVDEELGNRVRDTYLPAKTRQLIEDGVCQNDGCPLVVIHDVRGSVIPWEVMHFGARCPALDAGVSRLYRAEANEVLIARSNLPASALLKMLVIYDPTEDLPGAGKEGSRLKDIVSRNYVEVMVLNEANATRARVIHELATGGYHIVHYAGHADFDDAAPDESGLLCADGRLRAEDLPRLTSAPQLIFLNACKVGRIRRKQKLGREQTDDLDGTLAANLSIAQGFMLQGVLNFIGTYWPVNDSAALNFAATLYNSLLGGDAIGLALKKSRHETKSGNPRDWANYMHFGDPSYRLRQPAR